jgi:hypothetical protein
MPGIQELKKEIQCESFKKVHIRFLVTNFRVIGGIYRLNKPMRNTPTPPRRNIAPRTVPTYVLGARRNIPTTAPKIPAIINPILTMRYPSTTRMCTIIKMWYMRFNSAFCRHISNGWKGSYEKRTRRE